MTGRQWPSRAEWEAKAEYAVRTFCTMYERLPEGSVFTKPSEDMAAEERAERAAKAVRPVLSAEITRLKALLPDRPAAGRARVVWLLALEGEEWENSQNLAGLESIRRKVAAAAKTGDWGAIRWQLGRVRIGYPAVQLPPAVCDDLDWLNALDSTVSERRRVEAQCLEDDAVAREMARRATDDAWRKELERRQRVESPRVIHH